MTDQTTPDGRPGIYSPTADGSEVPEGHARMPRELTPEEEARAAREMSTPDALTTPWRTGRHVGRTVYAQTGPEPTRSDVLIGVMDTPEIAQAAVDAHNAGLTTEAERDSDPLVLDLRAQLTEARQAAGAEAARAAALEAVYRETRVGRDARDAEIQRLTAKLDAVREVEPTLRHIYSASDGTQAERAVVDTVDELIGQALDGDGARATDPSEANPIPLYAQLDLWMFLGGDPADFDAWREQRTFADAWAELLGMVRSLRTRTPDWTGPDPAKRVETTTLADHKKPIEVEAFQFTGTGQSHADVEEWAAGLIRQGKAAHPRSDEGASVFWGDCHGLYIDTPGGRMHAAPGDWVVCGAQGTFYTRKPDSFEAAYEPATT